MKTWYFELDGVRLGFAQHSYAEALAALVFHAGSEAEAARWMFIGATEGGR